MQYIEKTEIRVTSRPAGWAMDVDLANNPTYPMRDRHLPEEKGYSWERPEQQPLDVPVLHSNERPDMPAVFGTSTPPSGVSGLIRRFAYRYSESSNMHWMPLILADRVNMVEGILSDLRDGRLPNVFKEAGWGVQWRYERGKLLRRVGLLSLFGAAIAAPFVVPRLRGPRQRTSADELLGAPLCEAGVPHVAGDVEAGGMAAGLRSRGMQAGEMQAGEEPGADWGPYHRAGAEMTVTRTPRSFAPPTEG